MVQPVAAVVAEATRPVAFGRVVQPSSQAQQTVASASAEVQWPFPRMPVQAVVAQVA